MDRLLCAPPRLNCIDLRNGWMTMRERTPRGVLHQRTQGSRDSSEARFDCGSVGCDADCGWVSSEDDDRVSASATAAGRRERESERQGCTGWTPRRGRFVDGGFHLCSCTE